MLFYYSLEQRNGGFCEPERYCQAAIEMDPERHNAYKNLGIALQNLGGLAGAAKSFINAAKMCPTDCRALEHLKELIGNHPEIFEEIPDLCIQLHRLHRTARGMNGKIYIR
jgi:tetratricopeptide (TPR) repeat protein